MITIEDNLRKIELRITQLENDLIKEFKIIVLPTDTINQVKNFIDATLNISPENIILKKLTEELADNLIVDNIKRTKKDSYNLIHLSARFLANNSNIKAEIKSSENVGNYTFSS